MSTDRERLPELPTAVAFAIDLEADMRGFLDVKAWSEDEFTTALFTADQMRSYALQCVEAERERLAAMVEGNHLVSAAGPSFTDGWANALISCAAAIRKGS